MNQKHSRCFGIQPQHHAKNSALPEGQNREHNSVSYVRLEASESKRLQHPLVDAVSRSEDQPEESCTAAAPLDGRVHDATDDHPTAEVLPPECKHFGEDLSPTPETCNTGVPIRHPGGLDTIEVSLYGYWHPANWDSLKRDLDAAKKRAESGLEETAYIRSCEGQQLIVRPTGVRRGVHCRWLLEWNGCHIAIVNSPWPSESRLSVHVTIGAIRLMEVGHEEAWASVLSVLALLEYEHDREVVGRVDLCTDHADRSMAEVEAAVNEKRLICRARKSKRYENADQLETYVRGSGPTLVRIYDKAVECRNDPVKRAVMIRCRWGKECDHAVRVEFQLRNKSLQRHFSIKTMEDLFSSLGTIAKWCTGEWFRVVNAFDRKNRNHARAETSDWWNEVQEQFEEWTGTALPRVPREFGDEPDFDRLKEQAVGCVSTIVAHREGDFWSNWVAIGKELLEKAEKAIPFKRMKLEAQHRAWFPDLVDVPF